MTRVQNWNVARAAAVRATAGSARPATSAAYTTGLWNTTAVNPALTLTQASHPASSPAPNTCVLEGVDLHAVQPGGEHQPAA